MNRRNRSFTRKVIALILIVALLSIVGVSTSVIVFLVSAGLFVSYIAKRAEQKETQRIFAFYIEADEVLRHEEREWYGFEIAEVLNDSDHLMNSMPDAPPLYYFAVGALYHKVGNYRKAADYLSPLIDSEWIEARRMENPSPQLRRYIELLRELERDPSISPQALGAVRSLERQRQKHLVNLTIESREKLSQMEKAVAEKVSAAKATVTSAPENISSLSSMVPPPSIAEVLHEVYDDAKPS